MGEPSEVTKTGNLPFHLAAAACYCPVMYIHLLAAIVFLATEPKEHRMVRFHAVQSLLVFATWMASTFLALLLMFITPFAFLFAGAALSGVSEDLAGILALVGLLGQALFGFLSIAAAFGGIVVLGGMMVLLAMEKDVRIPGLAGLADRFAGSPG